MRHDLALRQVFRFEDYEQKPRIPLRGSGPEIGVVLAGKASQRTNSLQRVTSLNTALRFEDLVASSIQVVSHNRLTFDANTSFRVEG